MVKLLKKIKENAFVIVPLSFSVAILYIFSMFNLSHIELWLMSFGVSGIFTVIFCLRHEKDV